MIDHRKINNLNSSHFLINVVPLGPFGHHKSKEPVLLLFINMVVLFTLSDYDSKTIDFKQTSNLKGLISVIGEVCGNNCLVSTTLPLDIYIFSLKYTQEAAYLNYFETF